MFSRLGIRRTLTVNTYVGVRWLVVDEQSGKDLHINNTKYFDSTPTDRLHVLELYITVPSELSLIYLLPLLLILLLLLLLLFSIVFN